MFINPAGSGKGYQIAHAVRLRAAASAYWRRTFSAGSAQQFTLSCWVKLGSLSTTYHCLLNGGDGTQTNSTNDSIIIDTNNQIKVMWKSGVAGNWSRTFSPILRDPNAWYHVVIRSDLGNATVANRIMLWLNGVQITSYMDSTTAPNGSWTYLNQAYGHNISRLDQTGGPTYGDFYLAEYNFIGGNASLTGADFGQIDPNNPSNWIPKKYTGSYSGTNSTYVPFNDGTSATTLGYDRSGNGNNWTASGISTTAGVTYDWLTDTPTNNYATLNAILPVNGVTLTNGNLTSSQTSASTIDPRGTIAVSSGKWYWEVTKTDAIGSGHNFGVIDVTQAATVNNFTGSNSVGYYSSNGNRYLNGVSAAYGTSYTTNDVIGIELDLDSGTQTIRFYKNGTVQGSGAYINLTGGLTWVPTDSNGGGGTVTAEWNFGQRPFAYTPPTGFKALCTANLPAVAIPNPSQAIAHRYEAGSGIAANIASDRGSWASWIEIFKRGDTSESWKVRFSTDTSNMWAFDSNAAKAAWSAPSAGTYLGIALRVGSTYGIDTGTYSGNGSASQDVSHSLGVAPTAAIIKDESTGSVYFWHSKMTGATYFTIFNSATPPAQSNTNTPFGGSGWLSSTFGVTNNATNNLNASSHTYRYILFSDVSGLLRMLGFTGNGSTDGAFEYAGQRPQIQIEKDLAATTGIYLFSDMIDTYNVTASYLLMNSSAAVAAATGVDIVANGIKHRSATVVNAANSHAAISLSRQSFGGSNVSPACAR